MHNFKELIVWQKSRTLVKEIYLTTTNLPVNEQFGLSSQMRRAVYSIPSNIAEGAGRGSYKDFARFLDMANGSCFELETQLFLCLDLNYIDEARVNYLIYPSSGNTKNDFFIKIKVSKS
jgi:four helix bundle protein